MKRTLLLTVIALVVAGTGHSVFGEEAATFEKSFVPMVQQHCIRCHGPVRPHAGLDLTRREAVLGAGGRKPPVVIAGKPNESALMQRLADGSMPADNDGAPLADDVIARIHGWIAGGAQWPPDYVITPPLLPQYVSTVRSPLDVEVNPNLAEDPNSLRSPRRFRGRLVRTLAVRCWRHCQPRTPLIAERNLGLK